VVAQLSRPVEDRSPGLCYYGFFGAAVAGAGLAVVPGATVWVAEGVVVPVGFGEGAGAAVDRLEFP